MPLALWGARFKEKLYMKHNNSSFANPLKVVLNRIGEPCLAHYGAARTPLDTPEKAHAFWGEIIAQEPSFESDKEHLVAILLDTKLRPIGYHVVSVGTINEAIAHPREIFRAAIVAAAYGLVLMHNLCGAPHKLCYVQSGLMCSERKLARQIAGTPCFAGTSTAHKSTDISADLWRYRMTYI